VVQQRLGTYILLYRRRRIAATRTQSSTERSGGRGRTLENREIESLNEVWRRKWVGGIIKHVRHPPKALETASIGITSKTEIIFACGRQRTLPIPPRRPANPHYYPGIHRRVHKLLRIRNDGWGIN